MTAYDLGLPGTEPGTLHQNLAFDPSNLEYVGMNLWSVGSVGRSSSSVAATYYKMRGQDAAVNGLYDTWIASGAPDTAGTYYSGALALPLRDVVVVDSWSALPGSIASGNPFVDPPTIADSFDDEFSSGSADLAVRGWTIKTIAGATLTRPAGSAGDVRPWDTTGPAAGNYWSTIIGSWIFIQVPASTQVYLYKAVTLVVGETYFMRCGTPFRHDSGATGRFQEVAFWQASAGVPDAQNRVYVSYYELSTAPQNLDMGRTLANVFGGTSRNKWYDVDIKGIYYKASTNDYRTFGVNSATGDSVVNSPTGGPSAANIAYFGVSHLPGAAAATPSVLAVDYARRVTGHKWIVNP